MDELIEKLSGGTHPVKLESRTKSLAEVKDRINNGFVFITFTDTRGGTELGITLDNDLIDISSADFSNGKGTVKISGTCELNYHKVKCYANIDLETCDGNGWLVLLN